MAAGFDSQQSCFVERKNGFTRKDFNVKQCLLLQVRALGCSCGQTGAGYTHSGEIKLYRGIVNFARVTFGGFSPEKSTFFSFLPFFLWCFRGRLAQPSAEWEV